MEANRGIVSAPGAEQTRGRAAAMCRGDAGQAGPAACWLPIVSSAHRDFSPRVKGCASICV